MLSSIVTVIICIVGALVGINCICGIFVELNPATRVAYWYYKRLLFNLPDEDVHEIGAYNLAKFVSCVCFYGEFDYWYDRLIEKEK